MLKGIPKSDIVKRPFEVYKQWTLTHDDTQPLYGIVGEPPYADPEDPDVEMTALYHSVKQQFYENAATASLLSEVGFRRSYASTDERIIADTIGVIAIPQIKYGEGVLPKSVTLEYDSIELTDDGYSNLIDGSEQVHGNIFYDRGIVVLTKSIDIGDDPLKTFTLGFRSTMTIYENEILLAVSEHEFNVSQNPTAVEDDIIIKQGFLDYQYSSSLDPTGSYLAPFVTTIGLYDNDNQMVAVAKLPKPIKCYPDYPMNFIIRLDT